MYHDWKSIVWRIDFRLLGIYDVLSKQVIFADNFLKMGQTNSRLRSLKIFSCVLFAIFAADKLRETFSLSAWILWTDKKILFPLNWSSFSLRIICDNPNTPKTKERKNGVNDLQLACNENSFCMVAQCDFNVNWIHRFE